MTSGNCHETKDIDDFLDKSYIETWTKENKIDHTIWGQKPIVKDMHLQS